MHHAFNPIDLAAALPHLLPNAVAWAEAQRQYIVTAGRPLSAADQRLATQVGVAFPGRVRVLAVTAIPVPDDPPLAAACALTGFLGGNTTGLTLFEGIYLRTDTQGSRRLLAHELRHVHQYEAQGSIAAFLQVYLPQVLTYGYAAAPLERDARAAAQRALAGCG
jgi:hypothetical protein